MNPSHLTSPRYVLFCNVPVPPGLRGWVCTKAGDQDGEFKIGNIDPGTIFQFIELRLHIKKEINHSDILVKEVQERVSFLRRFYPPQL